MMNRIGHWRNKRGLSMKELADRIGSTPSTVNKLEKGYMRLTQQWLMLIAKALNVQPADLLPPSDGLRPTASSGGFHENAVVYQPPPGHFLQPSPHFMYLEMRTADLEQHPERAGEGTILVFDLNVVEWQHIKPGEVVYVSMMDPGELTRTHGALIGQYMPPNKLTSNAATDNWIINLADPDLEFKPVLRGVLRSVIRKPAG